jgi:hypothetical protein
MYMALTDVRGYEIHQIAIGMGFVANSSMNPSVGIGRLPGWSVNGTV